MYALQIEKGVIKNLRKLPPKIFRQIIFKVLSLQQTPLPNDCKPIGPGYRVDSGEYRILYFVDDTTQLIEIVLVGKRNDDDVYRQFERRFGR